MLCRIAAKYSDSENFLEAFKLDPDTEVLEHDNDASSKITLITVHSAKGCECDYAYIFRVQNGVFPHIKATSVDEIEEERRVLYVAMTRARKELILTRTISVKELKELLLDNLNALWENDSALHTKHASAANMIPPIMVWGAPGVGKSTAVRELTQELGIGFIDVRLAQREPVDMRGLPVPDEKENSVKWLVSGEWPRDPASRGIIMFDELTAADKTLQVAAYEFILDRRLGALYNVPDGWYIMAAGNRIEDRAVSCAMSSALANRFLHVEVAAEANSFLEWAKENNLHPAVTGFIKFRPELLFSQENEDLQRGWPSPRSWERVSTMLKIAEKNQRKSSLKYTIPGLIGQGAASEFMAFYKNMYYMGAT